MEEAHRGWWPFAYSMLSDIAGNYSQQDDALVERLYRSMRSGDGVYKITRRGRFDAFNMTLADQIERLELASPVLRIHDMAASSAITSLELFQVLRDRFPVEFRASDWFDRIYIVKPARSTWKVAFDVEGAPLQLEGHGLVLSAHHPEPWRFVLNRLVQTLVQKKLVAQARSLLLPTLRDQPYRPTAGSVEAVTLFHPEAIRTASEDKRFTLDRENLFAPRTVEFDVIRIMNALTQHHFQTDRVLQAISAIAANVREGGLLVLGRSVDEEDGRLRATAYVRKGTRLVPRVHAGEAYELTESVEALQLPEISKLRSSRI